MSIGTQIRARLARFLGTTSTRVFGAAIPIVLQRGVRFCYCPWVGRGGGLKRSVRIPGTSSKIELHTASYVDWQIWCYGTQDYAIEQQIRLRAMRGSVFIDVGANVGYFSCLAASLGARVFAFEPVSCMFSRLTMLNELNSKLNITPLRLGCSDASGSCQISLPKEGDQNWGTSSILRTVSEDFETIELVSLDDFCEREGLEGVDFIKIDVEGAEHLVIKGLRRVLAKHRPVVVFEGNEESRTPACQTLEEQNYSLRKLTKTSMDLVAIPR